MNIDKISTVESLEYNSLREKLIIPEYGRYIHKLIEQVAQIEDREKRNKGAKYIISVLGTLNPHLRDVPEFQHKLWDQLFIMSDFKMDVDSPYPIPTREVTTLRPERLAYPQNFPKYRFYGNNIKYMIDVACKWEDGELKSALILVIANHMKKCFLSWNKDTVTDEVIFQHLYELSNGKIDLLTTTEELSTSQNLLKVNKKYSNKSQHSNNKSVGFQRNSNASQNKSFKHKNHNQKNKSNNYNHSNNSNNSNNNNNNNNNNNRKSN